MGVLFRRELGRGPGPRPVAQRPIQPLLDTPLPDAVHRGDADIEGDGDLRIRETLVRLFSSTRARVRVRTPRVPAWTSWVRASRSAAVRLRTYFAGPMESSLAEDATGHLHAGCHCYHIHRD